MLAVGTASGHHHLSDPNQFCMQSVWTGQFGRIAEDESFKPIRSREQGFSLTEFPWSFSEPRSKVDHQ